MFRTEEVNSFSEVYACSTHIKMVGVSGAPLIPQSWRGGDRRVPGRDLVSNNQKIHNPKCRHLYSRVHTCIRIPHLHITP